MSSPRYPLPTDIVALASLDGRVYPNEARPWDRLGQADRPRPLETALEQWFSFATGKRTWVSVRGATIRGLVSARRRSRPSVWEVEVLIDADEDKDVVLSLLTRMIADVGKQGAERVFLRLDADSPHIASARSAGFLPYLEETLYRRTGPGPVPPPLDGWRPRRRGDLLGLFQLYTRAVPSAVRAVEGLTLREWQAAQEPWVGHPIDLVLEENGAIDLWLRLVRGPIGRFSLLAHPSRRDLEGAVGAALRQMADVRSVQVLVPAHCAGLVPVLQGLGFRAAGRYVHLVQRLLRPVGELAQEQASNIIPAS